MEKNLQKNISYMLQFIDSEYLWQAHQTLSIIFLEEFIKLNANTDTKIKM